MTDNQLYELIKPHIQDVSGLRMIIPARSNIEAPSGPYGSVDVSAETTERGQANIIERHNHVTEQIDTEIRVQAQVSVVVEFFRDGAHNYAKNLLQFGKYEHVQWGLFKSGFGVRGTGPVLDLTALQSSNQEPRARITIELWGVYSHNYSTNIIERVGIVARDEKSRILREVEVKGLF